MYYIVLRLIVLGKSFLHFKKNLSSFSDRVSASFAVRIENRKIIALSPGARKNWFTATFLITSMIFPCRRGTSCARNLNHQLRNWNHHCEGDQYIAYKFIIRGKKTQPK